MQKTSICRLVLASEDETTETSLVDKKRYEKSTCLIFTISLVTKLLLLLFNALDKKVIHIIVFNIKWTVYFSMLWSI